MTKRLTLAVCGALVLLPSTARAQNPYSTEFLERRETLAQFGSAVAVGDFDGNGRDDLAVGVPGAAYRGPSGSVWRAGRVCVYLELGTNNTAHCVTERGNGAREFDDQFGYTVAAGDFNGDGVDDLAVGIPYEDFGTTGNAGAVQVLLGSRDRYSRFQTATTFLQGMPFVQNGMPRMLRDLPESGDRFGAALAVGDFDADGVDDLAIGVPGEDIFAFGMTVVDAGAVHVLYGGAGGLGVSDRLWTQNDLAPQIIPPGADYELAEMVDQFGSSLAAARFNGDAADDLAIGVPFEDRFRWDGTFHPDAGVVHVLYGSNYGLRTPANGCCAYTPQLWHQDVLGAGQSAEAADRFGFAVARRGPERQRHR